VHARGESASPDPCSTRDRSSARSAASPSARRPDTLAPAPTAPDASRLTPPKHAPTADRDPVRRDPEAGSIRVKSPRPVAATCPASPTRTLGVTQTSLACAERRARPIANWDPVGCKRRREKRESVAAPQRRTQTRASAWFRHSERCVPARERERPGRVPLCGTSERGPRSDSHARCSSDATARSAGGRATASRPRREDRSGGRSESRTCCHGSGCQSGWRSGTRLCVMRRMSVPSARMV
jgi:hypothetical protein